MCFGNPEGQLVVAVDIVGVEVVEVDEVGPEMVNDGAKSQAVPPRRRHVDDVDFAVGDVLAPVLQVLRSLQRHLYPGVHFIHFFLQHRRYGKISQSGSPDFIGQGRGPT